jgi:hypothetical protein
VSFQSVMAAHGGRQLVFTNGSGSPRQLSFLETFVLRGCVLVLPELSELTLVRAALSRRPISYRPFAMTDLEAVLHALRDSVAETMGNN